METHREREREWGSLHDASIWQVSAGTQAGPSEPPKDVCLLGAVSRCCGADLKVIGGACGEREGYVELQRLLLLLQLLLGRCFLGGSWGALTGSSRLILLAQYNWKYHVDRCT